MAWLELSCHPLLVMLSFSSELSADLSSPDIEGIYETQVNCWNSYNDLKLAVASKYVEGKKEWNDYSLHLLHVWVLLITLDIVRIEIVEIQKSYKAS